MKVLVTQELLATSPNTARSCLGVLDPPRLWFTSLPARGMFGIRVHGKLTMSTYPELTPHTTFRARKTEPIPLLTRTPMALEMGRRDLPNRVCSDVVCSDMYILIMRIFKRGGQDLRAAAEREG